MTSEPCTAPANQGEIEWLRDSVAAAVSQRDTARRIANDLAAQLGTLRATAAKALDDIEDLHRMQDGKEADYVPGAHAAHLWWRTCLAPALADLRAALAVSPPAADA